MGRQEQYALCGAGPDIRSQTAWLDFISSITDNTADLHYCQIISSLFRALAVRHNTAESWSREERDGWVIDLRSGIHISICCHFCMILLFKKKTMAVISGAPVPEELHPDQEAPKYAL